MFLPSWWCRSFSVMLLLNHKINLIQPFSCLMLELTPTTANYLILHHDVSSPAAWVRTFDALFVKRFSVSCEHLLQRINWLLAARTMRNTAPLLHSSWSHWSNFGGHYPVESEDMITLSSRPRLTNPIMLGMLWMYCWHLYILVSTWPLICLCQSTSHCQL